MLLKDLSPEAFAQKLADPAALLKLSYLNELLLCSEYMLIQFMNKKGAWQGPLPPPPSGWPDASASIDLGTVLYLFNNTPQIKDQWIRQYAGYAKTILSLPASQLTTQNYNWICSNVLLYDDGSVISGGAWETYDQGWFAAFLNMIISDLEDGWYGWQSGSPAPVQLKPRKDAYEVVLGIVGDWGTGDTSAKGVIRQLTNHNPNYIIHLGDVYYSGTPSSGPMAGHYFNPGEEQNNLLAVWPKTGNPDNLAFTLNSNHEMYAGANGYFGDALLSPGTPFAAQKGLSYFALKLGGWTILGLDSAYFGTTRDAFMSGYLKNFLHQEQTDWIANLNLDPTRTIVLTHHTGFQWDASGFMTLWDEVTDALGGDPYAWYWGHVHNGIAYTSPLTMPGTNGQPRTTTTFARCLGHSALPYGEATVLKGNPGIRWMETGAGLLPNGFGTLRFILDGNGMVVGILENFFHLGTTAPVFTNRLF